MLEQRRYGQGQEPGWQDGGGASAMDVDGTGAGPSGGAYTMEELFESVQVG